MGEPSKGPWFARGVMVGGPNGETIVSGLSSHVGNDLSLDERRANAKLIAKARLLPELVEELLEAARPFIAGVENISPDADPHEYWESGCTTAELTRLAAAIAKTDAHRSKDDG